MLNVTTGDFEDTTMTNTTDPFAALPDTFEGIAADAVDLLLAIIADLGESEDEGDKMAAVLIGLTAASFCRRAIALGSE